jgi:hypothetical protein
MCSVAPKDQTSCGVPRTLGRNACKQGTLADRPAMDPLVSDGNRPELATVRVVNNNDRQSKYGGNRTQILFRRDPAASELWNDYYATLSQAKSGLHGAATGRADARVLRMSAIYAALDCSSTIRLPHLEAALTLWDFCSYSACLAAVLSPPSGSPSIPNTRSRRKKRTPNPKNPGRSKPSTLTAHFLAISRSRISCLAALAGAARAPFRKERRMKFTEATKFHRKWGPRVDPMVTLRDS